MGSAPADGRENPLGDGESGDVLRRGFAPNEDRRLAARRDILHSFAGEAGMSAGDAGRGDDGLRYGLRRLGEPGCAGDRGVDIRDPRQRLLAAK